MYIVDPFYKYPTKRRQQEKKQEREENIASCIDEIWQWQVEKSIYYFTYPDIIHYFKSEYSYNDLYKFMPKFIEDNPEYLRLGFPNEAHFVHKDFRKQYYEISLPQWKSFKSIKRQTKHSADLRGWTSSTLHIDRLQLKLNPSASSSIGKKFYQNNLKHKKPSSDVVVLEHEKGADRYKFISYQSGALTIYVLFFNSMEVYYSNFRMLFDYLRKITLYYSGYNSHQIPFSFITNQIYPLYESFDRSKSYHRAKPHTSLSLTFSELIPYLKYHHPLP